MMMLTIIGLFIMASLVGWGAFAIFKSIQLKKTTDRYRYVKTKDENGNEITKVVDLENDEDSQT